MPLELLPSVRFVRPRGPNDCKSYPGMPSASDGLLRGYFAARRVPGRQSKRSAADVWALT